MGNHIIVQHLLSVVAALLPLELLRSLSNRKHDKKFLANAETFKICWENEVSNAVTQ